MNKLKTTKFDNYWQVRIPQFPDAKRNQVLRLANSNRVSIGAYIGNLLDEEIRKASKEERV